jgi:hypothetical protein
MPIKDPLANLVDTIRDAILAAHRLKQPLRTHGGRMGLGLMPGVERCAQDQTEVYILRARVPSSGSEQSLPMECLDRGSGDEELAEVKASRPVGRRPAAPPTATRRRGYRRAPAQARVILASLTREVSCDTRPVLDACR